VILAATGAERCRWADLVWSMKQMRSGGRHAFPPQHSVDKGMLIYIVHKHVDILLVLQDDQLTTLPFGRRLSFP